MILKRNSKGATTNIIVITVKPKENREFVNKNLASAADLGVLTRENTKIDFRGSAASVDEQTIILYNNPFNTHNVGGTH